MKLSINMTDLRPTDLLQLIPIMEKLLPPDLPGIQTPVEEIKAPVEEPKKAAPVLDLEVVRSQLHKLKADKGTEALKGVLTKFGVTRVPDLPADRYEDVLEAIALCYATEDTADAAN